MDSKVKCFINEIKNFPPEMLIKKLCSKVTRKVLNSVGKISSTIFRTEFTDERFLRHAWNSKFEFQNSEELVKYFQNRRKPNFFLNFLILEESANIPESFPDTSAKIIPEADKLCKHIFNLLGSGDVNLGEKINWHCDFKTGYQWNPDKYYKDIEIPVGKADIKVPWELSRFQHFALLGKAYRLTGDAKYAREFVNQVSDWIDRNKPKFGLNWRCTMEVAIRLANWILGYYYFKTSPEVTNEFFIKLLKSIYQHGKHIKSNLEYGLSLTSNHYLSDIVGLVFISVIFPEFKKAEKWRSFAIKELQKEMEKQVYNDGCDFEASTCYHRLVLELFFFSTLLLVINDNNFNGENHREISQEIFGKEYTDKLYKMFDAVCYLLKPNGRMPQIGDNDSGQLFKLYPRQVLDMRYLLALGAVFFKESKWKIKEFFNSEEDIAAVLIVYGGKGKEIWDSLQWNALKNIKSKAFPDAGWYVMRDNRNYCIVCCGPNGQNGNGGHCHNDKLSFELCINGEDVIVDPGTYVYTSDIEARNRFRSTAFHNTVMIDGEEQSRFDKNNMFCMKDDALCRCLKWEMGEGSDFFIEEHYGYKRLANPVIHRREIRFHKKEGRLEIKDGFRGKGVHHLGWNFILSPNYKQALKIKSDKMQWHKESAFYSPEYGVIDKNEKFVSMVKMPIPFETRFSIEI